MFYSHLQGGIKMAYFSEGIRLTEQGKALSIKMLADPTLPLAIEAVAIGNGEDISRPPNELKNELFRTTGYSTRIVSPTLMSFDLDFSDFASTQTEPWIFREVGIFATDPQLGTILYAYGNTGKHYDVIPPAGASTYVKRKVQILVEVSNAESVIVNVDSEVNIIQRLEGRNGIEIVEENGKIIIQLAD